MHHLFASHHEKIYFLISVVGMLILVAYHLFCTYGKGELAALMRHRRRIQFATLHLRLGVPMYVAAVCFCTWVYIGIFTALGWYTSMTFGLAGALVVGIYYCILLTQASRDQSALAEASVFMDYDIRMPSIRFKVKTR